MACVNTSVENKNQSISNEDNKLIKRPKYVPSNGRLFEAKSAD